MAQSFASDHPEAAPTPRLRAALERLDGLVDWERRDRTARMRVTVEPSRALLAGLGDPQKGFFAIHVAGTKGKGSVSALIAAGLRKLGASTGTYASPHVERVNERVCLGSSAIEDEDLAFSLEAALDERGASLGRGGPAEHSTWFDVLTASAFHAFARAEIDVAVVECGLGGRLDSTNVLGAQLCVITNIGLEHTAVLGDTREAIAREKAGIIGPGAIVVMGLCETDPAGRVILEVARDQGAKVHAVSPTEGASISEFNRLLARRVLDELGRLAPERLLHLQREAPWGQALDGATCESVRLPGRMERRWVGETTVVLDGAHTPESLRALLETLEADADLPGRCVSVFGTGGEKNASLLLKALGPRTDSVLCTSVGPGPYRAPEELRSIAHELGIDAMAIDDPQAALDEALRLAGRERFVLVTGSLHLVGAIRRFTRS